MKIEFDDPRKQPLRGSTGLPLGGMGSIVEAMELSLKNIGVNILTGNGAKEILIKNNKVKGIVLSDGNKINTKLILSAINPKITLLNLIDNSLLEKNLKIQIENIKLKVGAFKAYIVVNQVPKFLCAPKGMEEIVAS